MEWQLVETLGAVVKVVWRVNVSARLTAHSDVHQVESVTRNRRVLFDVRHGVTRINLRFGSYRVRKVYDTNYLHKKKLLPIGQDGNSIPISNAVSRLSRGIQ